MAVTGASGDVVGAAQAGVAFRQLNASAEDVANFTSDTSNARDGAFVIAVRGRPSTNDPGTTRDIRVTGQGFAEDSRDIRISGPTPRAAVVT